MGWNDQKPQVFILISHAKVGLVGGLVWSLIEGLAGGLAGGWVGGLFGA